MNIKEEKKYRLESLLNFFEAINRLKKCYTTEQAIDVLDIYLKTNDPKYLTTYYDIREFVSNSTIRKDFYGVVYEDYNHLADYLNDYCSMSLTKQIKRR